MEECHDVQVSKLGWTPSDRVVANLDRFDRRIVRRFAGFARTWNFEPCADSCREAA